jgi:putative ABC transport system ATP-binding protein
VLVIRDLCRTFVQGARPRRVLEGVNLTIGTGERVAVSGRSGSGKSTLLGIVSGIDRADSGRVEFDGTLLSELAEPQRTLFRRRHVGFVHQFFNLLPTLDALENVRLVLELNGLGAAEAARRSALALERVGLADRLHSQVDALSGGEQQRVAIARALVHRPRLLLADEPTGNLDEASAAQIAQLLKSLAADQGATLLMVTHDARLAGECDRVLELREGRLHPLPQRAAATV